MFFEEQPLLLIPLIVLTVEVWLRVRGPLFAVGKKLLTRRPGTM
jgi:hypothetical protein